MSAVAEPVADALAGDRLARRNALVLAIAQALAGGNNTVLVATAAIVGTMLAPGQRTGDASDQHLRAGDVDGDAADGRAGASAGPSQRIADRYRLRRADRVDLLRCRAARLLLPVQCRRGIQRLLRLGTSVLSVCRRRYRERWVPAKGNFVGSVRRRRCRRGRSATRHRDPEFSGRPICSPRPISGNPRSLWSRAAC